MLISEFCWMLICIVGIIIFLYGVWNFSVWITGCQMMHEDVYRDVGNKMCELNKRLDTLHYDYSDLRNRSMANHRIVQANIRMIEGQLNKQEGK